MSQALAASAPCRRLQTLVARQPILDRHQRVFGYELLYREAPSDGACDVAGSRATARVLVGSFLEIGLDALIGRHRAFINFTADLLVDGSARALPRERVVLEVLEDVTVDAELVAAIRNLAHAGYYIALDDFVYGAEWEPLIDVAKMVKLDVRAMSRADVARHVELLDARGLKLLAEKVETREQVAHLKALGFHYFQGFFFARPSLVTRGRIPESHLGVLRLLSALQQSDVTVADIEPLVSADAALTYKLLRYLNSPYFGLARPIDSIGKALTYFGLEPLKRWVSLIALSMIDTPAPELLRMALVRARTCELLAAARGASELQPFSSPGCCRYSMPCSIDL